MDERDVVCRKWWEVPWTKLAERVQDEVPADERGYSRFSQGLLSRTSAPSYVPTVAKLARVNACQTECREVIEGVVAVNFSYKFTDP